MKLARIALMAGMAVAMASATSSVAWAQKCKDGETTDIASYKIEKGPNLDAMIKMSLTGKEGDPKKGLKWITHRRLGNCIACHKVTKILNLIKPGDLVALKKYGFHGNLAPSLDGLASRYTVGEIRMLVVNSKKIFPETIMPGYHNASGFNRVTGKCKGKVILSAERVEDVVAYLKTLK